MTNRKGIGGRPRLGPDLKKTPLNVRTDSALIERIKRFQARERIKSTTQAIERLVRRGLDEEAA